MASNGSKTDVIDFIDSNHLGICARQRDLFSGIAEADKLQLWIHDGCRDMTEWVSARFDINSWKARRWVKAAHALERLPILSESFATGRVCIDKVLELARFVEPADEERWIKWAIKVKVSTVRERADVETRPQIEETKDNDRTRFLDWYWNEDKTQLHLHGTLPSVEGKVVIDALDSLATEIPSSPEDELPQLGDEDPAEATIEARRADALVMLASGGVTGKGTRPKVVVHAELEALLENSKNCELEGVGVIHPHIARRLMCDCKLEFVVYAKDGQPLGIGTAAHDPPRSLRRLVKRRDKGCVFPGCSMKRFVQVHHIEFDRDGIPRTDYDALICLCHFHHKLVHEYGWRVELGEIPGTADWFRPDGARLRTGPAPPRGDPLLV